MTTTTTTSSTLPAADEHAPAVVPAPASQTLSILALVFGLAAFAGFGFLAAVAAIVLGVLAWRREPHAHTLSLIGMIAAGVHLVGGLLFGILGFVFAAPFLAMIPFLSAF